MRLTHVKNTNSDTMPNMNGTRRTNKHQIQHFEVYGKLLTSYVDPHLLYGEKLQGSGVHRLVDTTRGAVPEILQADHVLRDRAQPPPVLPLIEAEPRCPQNTTDRGHPKYITHGKQTRQRKVRGFAARDTVNGIRTEVTANL